VPLDWLPEAQLECPVCRGTGFNPQTLEVRLLGRNVAQLLTLSLQDAATLFDGFARIAPVLRTFVDLGLGYLTLGQSASSLSGGEAQRVKLACELSRGRSLAEAGGTLYVLDEPTTGLHPADIERLLQVLRGLVDQGHTVLTIEHQLDLVASANWLIDLGPEGGAGGGRVIAAGTPPQVAHAGTGPTALALRQHTGW
jgi:excinuclease ABC subunit A